MAEADKQCGNPKCTKVGKHLCSGCGGETYCSKACQKDNWPAHKPVCNAATKPEAVAFLKNLDSLSIKQLKNILKAKATQFEPKKKEIVLSRLDNIVEKPALVKYVSEYVEMGEVETLLSTPVPASTNNSSSSSTGPHKGKRKKVASAGNTRNNHQPTPSPDQMRQQASMMRKNPNMVRKANAAFSKMTDEQIRAYADQLDQAASNPEMMKEVERMSRLSEGERLQLQSIQEGLSGMKPMDSTWMDETIKALKANPGMFKSMVAGKGALLGGVTDEQLGSYIDMFASLDAYVLKCIFLFMSFLGSLYKPAVALYTTVDSYTFGGARYIALALLAVVAYYTSVVMWIVGRWIISGLYALYRAVFPATVATVVNSGIAQDGVASTAAASAASAGGAIPPATIAAGVAVGGEGIAAAAVGTGAATAAATAVGVDGRATVTAEAQDAEFDF